MVDEEMNRRLKISSVWFKSHSLWVTLSLAGGVFVLDLSTPRGFAEEMLYTAVVFWATQTLPRRLVVAVAGLCTVLTILGFWLSLPGMPEEVSMTNRGFSVAAIWAIALLSLQRARAEEKLQTKEDQVRLVVEHVRDYGIVMLAADGRVASWNIGAEKMTGYSLEDAVGRTFSHLFRENATNPQWSNALLSLAIATGQAEDEGWCIRKDGTAYFAHMVLTPLRNDVGELQGFATVTQDLTQKKEAHETIVNLTHISQKLSSTLETEQLLDDLVVESIRLIGASSGFAGLMEKDRIVSHKYFQDGRVIATPQYFLLGEGLPGWVILQKALYVTNDAGHDRQIDLHLRDEFGIQTAVCLPILDGTGNPLGILELHNKKDPKGFTKADEAKLLGVAQAASIALQNALTYRKLQQAEAVHEQLLNKLMTAQEDERRRLSRELHDEIGQSLTSLLVGLRSLEESARDHLLQVRAKDLRVITAQTLFEVQRLARGLRPSLLDDLGLQEAVSRYAVEFEQTHGIPVEVHVAGLDGGRLPSLTETALYRIIQEALTNIAKHATAKTVSIILKCLPSEVQLIVEDDGCGFSVEPMVHAMDPTHKLGLYGMQERANSLQGNLMIESTPQMGTTIYVRIPLLKETPDANSRAHH